MEVRITQRSMWQYLREHRTVSIIAGHLVVVMVFGLVLLSSTLGSTVFGAFAQTPCSSSDQTYVVRSGDTLGAIAGRYSTSWQKLASYNHIANANVIYISEHICIPGRGTGAPVTFNPTTIARGFHNPFAYPQCTFWANQRYYQLHGFYVPWSTNANAWQWVARAYDYHWHVSSTPVAGAIVVLQPWVQGAYSLGHVALAERILANGHVVASNTNWYPTPWSVTYTDITPGPGVSFVYA